MNLEHFSCLTMQEQLTAVRHKPSVGHYPVDATCEYRVYKMESFYVRLFIWKAENGHCYVYDIEAARTKRSLTQGLTYRSKKSLSPIKGVRTWLKKKS